MRDLKRLLSVATVALALLAAAPVLAVCTCGSVTNYPCALTETCDPGGLEVQFGRPKPRCDWKCLGTSCPDLVNVCPTATCDVNGDGLCVICGTDGANTINGTNGNDLICAKGGADAIGGHAGDDRIDGGSGNDTIGAGGGNKFVDAGPGNDLINGDFSDGTVHGGDGDDCINGGGGSDFLDGGNGNDLVVTSSDILTDASSPFYPLGPRVCGGAGDDVLWGRSSGHQCLDGGSGQIVPMDQTFWCLPTITFSADCNNYFYPQEPWDTMSVKNCGATFDLPNAGIFTDVDCGCRE